MTRSLASQNARLLVGVFLIFELLVALAVVAVIGMVMSCVGSFRDSSRA